MRRFVVFGHGDRCRAGARFQRVPLGLSSSTIPCLESSAAMRSASAASRRLRAALRAVIFASIWRSERLTSRHHHFTTQIDYHSRKGKHERSVRRGNPKIVTAPPESVGVLDSTRVGMENNATYSTILCQYNSCQVAFWPFCVNIIRRIAPDNHFMSI